MNAVIFRASLLLFALAAVGAAPGEARAQAAKVYELNELATKPRIASPMTAQRQIRSAYPRHLQDRGVEGQVMLAFVVGADGKVQPETVTVVSSPHDGLAEAASKAVVSIAFVPGRSAAGPVPSRVVFPISFVAKE